MVLLLVSFFSRITIANRSSLLEMRLRTIIFICLNAANNKSLTQKHVTLATCSTWRLMIVFSRSLAPFYPRSAKQLPQSSLPLEVAPCLRELFTSINCRRSTLRIDSGNLAVSGDSADCKDFMGISVFWCPDLLAVSASVRSLTVEVCPVHSSRWDHTAGGKAELSFGYPGVSLCVGCICF